MDDNSDSTSLLKRKTSKTYGYESYCSDFLTLMNWSSDPSQIDNAKVASSNEQSAFFLEFSELPIIDKYAIRLNTQFFSIKRMYFISCLTANTARAQIMTTLCRILEFCHAWIWHALFYRWFILSLAEFKMQILYRIANIIKHLMFIELEKCVGVAIRQYLFKHKLSGSYLLNPNEKFENSLKELKEFVEFSLLNFQDFFLNDLGWYMEESADTSRFIYHTKPYDMVKKFAYKNNGQAETLLHNSKKITFPQLTHMSGNEIDEVIYNHDKNYDTFFLGVISIQNPIFSCEDNGIWTDKKYNEDNSVIASTDIPHYSENIQQELAEQNLVRNLHPTTVFPSLRDGENEINKCCYEYRGRSYFRRFCREYDEESDGEGNSRNCKYSSSSERMFALDEEHSMLRIPGSKRKRKTSTDSEFLDFESRKEAQLNHRNSTILGSLEKNDDFSFQNNNSILTENLRRQELLESNSTIIETSPRKKTPNIPILERSSNGSVLYSSTFDEAKNSNSLGN